MPYTNPKRVLPDFHGNDSLPVLHIDKGYVSYRDDKIVFINLVASLPNGDVEQARMMIHEDDLQDLIDSMCTAIEYYPEKPSSKRSSPKNKK